MGGSKEIEEGATLRLDWHKLSKVQSAACAVVPVVVQDSRTRNVLIVAYANEKALAETLRRRVCCLWSTSRNELWIKGATSGDTLDLDEVRVNCEQNSLHYLVTPRRAGACHTRDETGCTRLSCYYRRLITEAGDSTSKLEHLPKKACGFVPIEVTVDVKSAVRIHGPSVLLGAALGASLALVYARRQ